MSNITPKEGNGEDENGNFIESTDTEVINGQLSFVLSEISDFQKEKPQSVFYNIQ